MHIIYSICIIGLLLVSTVQAQQFEMLKRSALSNDPMQQRKWLVRAAPQTGPRHLDIEDRFADVYAAAIQSGFITGSAGNFTFRSSLFGLGKIFHPEWDVDTEYLKRSKLRRVELSVDFTFDERQSLQSVQPSVNWILINRRDRADINFFELMRPYFKEAAQAVDRAYNSTIEAEGLRGDSLAPAQENRKKELDASVKTFNQSQNLQDLNIALRSRVEVDLDALVEKYEAQAEEIDQRVLLTLETGGQKDRTYNRDSLFARLSFYKGFSKRYDFAFKSNISVRDTATAEVDFSRLVWANSGGLDAVLVRDEKTALIEGRVALEYNRILRGRIAQERTNYFNFVITLSPLVSENLALPITLKWDPEEGDILARFSLQWRFSPIGKG